MIDHDTRAIHALRADAELWRTLTLAALDALHEAQRTIVRQREQLAEIREERERMARGVFGGPP